MTQDATSAYLLGHSDEELARLERQADLVAAVTEDTLRRAGLATGMRVLDLGCGVGDVSIAVAKLVGPTGQVTGVDRSAGALGIADRRFAAHGLTWARAVEGDVFGFDGTQFDAVVGRYILMHLPDPVAVLRHYKASLPPGGILAFVEMDIASAAITPAMPLFERCVQLIIDVYTRGGSEPNMGSRLFATMKAAGLSPHLHGSCRVEGGPTARVYDYLAQSIRSLWPSILAQGLDVDGIAFETLPADLTALAATADFCVAHPRHTGAWAVR